MPYSSVVRSRSVRMRQSPISSARRSRAPIHAQHDIRISHIYRQQHKKSAFRFRLYPETKGGTLLAAH